jgi:hypothetical protein
MGFKAGGGGKLRIYRIKKDVASYRELIGSRSSP